MNNIDVLEENIVLNVEHLYKINNTNNEIITHVPVHVPIRKLSQEFYKPLPNVHLYEFNDTSNEFNTPIPTRKLPQEFYKPRSNVHLKKLNFNF